MEANLKFDLPEEDYEFKHSVNGIKYFILLRDFYEKLRSYSKSDVVKTVDEIKTEYLELLNSENINLFE